MSAARRTPLIAAGLKMFFPFLVILPGLIAIALTSAPDRAVGAAGPPAAVGAVVQHQPGVIPIKIDSATGRPMLDARGHPQLDYDLATPNLLLRYFPTGMLGVGLTALLASFMSGMAGNVTAFNTVWTYDIYQAYIRPGAPDRHYLRVGRLTTAVGIMASIGAAYLASRFNNIMDLIQLVFAFVNAPVFATFLLGMFWKRTTGHGAFVGLATGMLVAALHHGLTLPLDDVVGVKGGWLAVTHIYPSEMAQNFWTAIWAWSACFVVTIAVSLQTRPKPEAELAGLVYSLTPKIGAERGPWYFSPVTLGLVMLSAALVLNIIFR
jgi:SSS family solute:Na+ symporter